MRRNDQASGADHIQRTGRSTDVPLLPDLLGGPRFQGQPLVAADGLKGYNSEVGDSVYYGDCVSGHGVFGGGGSCTLPLQVTTVVYRLHSNAPLGPQRNIADPGRARDRV